MPAFEDSAGSPASTMPTLKLNYPLPSTRQTKVRFFRDQGRLMDCPIFRRAGSTPGLASWMAELVVLNFFAIFP